METTTEVVVTAPKAKRQKGVTLLEYAIMAALIAAVAIAVIQTLGTKVNNTFQNINSKFNQ